jgi:hypothetical protein
MLRETRKKPKYTECHAVSIAQHAIDSARSRDDEKISGEHASARRFLLFDIEFIELSGGRQDSRGMRRMALAANSTACGFLSRLPLY